MKKKEILEKLEFADCKIWKTDKTKFKNLNFVLKFENSKFYKMLNSKIKIFVECKIQISKFFTETETKKKKKIKEKM